MVKPAITTNPALTFPEKAATPSIENKKKSDALLFWKNSNATKSALNAQIIAITFGGLDGETEPVVNTYTKVIENGKIIDLENLRLTARKIHPVMTAEYRGVTWATESQDGNRLTTEFMPIHALPNQW